MPPRKPKPGQSLAEVRPDLIDEWHPTNSTVPQEVSYGSGIKVLWLCKEYSHSWESSVVNRVVNARGCPYCRGKKVLRGFNDLYTTHPIISNQYHVSKNVGRKSPYEVTAGHNGRLWWNCGIEGHDWEVSVNSRCGKGTGCPYCIGKKVLVGFNDLNHKNPYLSSQWNQSKNTLSTSEVTPYSNKKYWWSCGECRHDWEASISDRSRGTGCPVCSGNKVIRGINDLGTTHPLLASQYHNLLNIHNKSPYEMSRGSNYIVWWFCDKGHEWEASVNDRTTGNGCPKCVNNLGSERHLILAIEDAIGPSNSRKIKSILWPSGRVFEVDYLHKSLIVEYDGGWHKYSDSRHNDTYKTKTLLDAGYSVVRLRQTPLPFLDLTHPNLLQVPVKWDKEGKDIKRVIDEEVIPWYESVQD